MAALADKTCRIGQSTNVLDLVFLIKTSKLICILFLYSFLLIGC